MLITLHGDNTYQINQRLLELEGDFKAENPDAEIEKLDCQGLEPDDLDQMLQAGSLFSQSRFIVLKGLASSKELSDKFNQIIPRLPESTTVVVVDSKLDKRTKLYHSLKSSSDQITEYNALDPPRLVIWLLEMAGDLQANLDRSVAAALVERVGTNQWQLSSELEKLANYDDTISFEMVNELVERTPQERIFDLLDAAVKGNSKRTLELYRDMLLASSDPYYVLSMIAWQLHNMLVVKASKGRRAEQTARETGISSFSLGKIATVVNSLGLSQIKSMIEAAAKADIKLKTSSAQPEAVVEHLLLKISQIAQE